MITWEEMTIRLVLAAIFGALVGLERERKNWSAGIRTHMMVSVGSCLIMLVSAYGFFDILGTQNVELDPSRIAAQVISGIGFIGAGTIMFLNQRIIRGLTTASGLWTVAAIGLATGGGMYFAAGITTFLALIILWGLQAIEMKFFKKSKHSHLKLVLLPNNFENEIITQIFSENNLVIQDFSIKKEKERQIYQIQFENIAITKIEKIIIHLKNKPYITEIKLS